MKRTLAIVSISLVGWSLTAPAARDFVSASSQYINFATAPVSGPPCTISFWMKRTDTTTAAAVVAVNSSATQRMQVNVGSSSLTAAALDTTASSSAATVNGVDSTSDWYHVMAVFAGSAYRSIFTNGVFGASNVTSRTVNSIDRVLVGARVNTSTVGAFFPGTIAEVAVWNVALTNAEAAILAVGAKPYRVRPDALVFYAPLWSNASTEQNLMGTGGTLTNSPTASAHPRVY